MRERRIVLALALSLLTGCRAADSPTEVVTEAATVPSGFTDTLVASGLSNPTLMEIAPDGRIFVSEQGGKLRVIKNGALLSAPFVTISVSTTGERGLLGIAFDPNFASEKWVYVYYTSPSGPHNKVSRFMVSSTNPDVATAGSEQTLFDLPSTLASSGFHNGGSIHFGKDGKLYISVGESTVGSRAQDMTTTMGKVLRINKDGTIPSDNPFFGSTTGNNRAIYAKGFRNPFSFAVQPGTGRIFVNDVGNSSQEEIDDLKAGANYGWPSSEGNSNTSGFTAPIHAYSHSQGCAITGGAFYNPATATFPAGMVGDYFFGDYCQNDIRRLHPATNTVSSFATGLNKPTDIKVGADGALYYLQRGNGSVRKIASTSNPLPVISEQPQDVTVAVGEGASFAVSASGPGPFTFQWQRNGAPIAGATGPTFTLASTTLADDGAVFRCVVSNGAGSVTSAGATLTVLDDRRPTATITTPAAGTTYSAGTTISFAGSGSDPEDGGLGAAAMTWRVDFFHDDGNRHSHPVMPPTSGITGGSFSAAPDIETSPNVWYRITLTVTDSAGLASTTSVDVLPNKVSLTLATDPPGLAVSLDGAAAVASPLTFTSVVGVNRSIGVAASQSLGGKSYAFTSWSDGGAATHTIAAPATGTTYTATFQETVVTLFEAETASFTGPTVSTKHPGFTGTGYLDFTNSNGDFVQWTVNAATAGSTPMAVRYANGGSSTIQVRVTVNGTNLSSNLSMPFTGANWEVWQTASFSANLAAGSNTIRLTTINLGQPNVDHLQLGAAAPPPPPTAPTITTQPQSQTVAAGASATFTVAASGTAPLSFQWQRDGASIAGATGSSFTLTSAQSSDSGASFRCVVSNSAGTATSTAAVLMVTTAPPPPTTQILEAETAAFTGPTLSTKHPGFTGTGYLDFLNSNGDFVEWTFSVASAGSFPLKVRYANGGSSTIQVRVTVNGTNLSSNLSMPFTGANWEVWQDAGFTAPLVAGSNKVRVTTINVGQPNVDHLQVN
jgi:glucose/arabinose dehydrogenase